MNHWLLQGSMTLPFHDTCDLVSHVSGRCRPAPCASKTLHALIMTICDSAEFCKCAHSWDLNKRDSPLWRRSTRAGRVKQWFSVPNMLFVTSPAFNSSMPLLFRLTSTLSHILCNWICSFYSHALYVWRPVELTVLWQWRSHTFTLINKLFKGSRNFNSSLSKIKVVRLYSHGIMNFGIFLNADNMIKCINTSTYYLWLILMFHWSQQWSSMLRKRGKHISGSVPVYNMSL